MPVFSRKELRQRLGLDYLHDTTIGNTVLSLGADATVVLMDRIQANPAFTGRAEYGNAYLRVASADYRISSVNFPSGGWVTQQLAIYPIASGADYEVGRRLSAPDKDRALDMKVRKIRVRRQVPISSVAGLKEYTLDGVASPHLLGQVLNVTYLANPTGSLDKRPRTIDNSGWGVADTPTGRILWLAEAMMGSQQVILDAILTLSLGSGDAATIRIPDQDWLLSGAAAEAFEMMARDAPGKEVTFFKDEARRFARSWTAGAAKYQPRLEYRPRFEDPVLGYEESDWVLR